jgi:hypothetical protein
MEDYADFFGGVDTLDVTDLMQPALVVGGGKSKSASTVRTFSKKLKTTKKKKRHIYSDESIVSILGSWAETEQTKPCPSFSELESKYIAGEEERILNELAAVVDTAKAFGGFSDSDDESTPAAGLTEIDNVSGGFDLTAIDEQYDGGYDLTSLDDTESVGMAGMSILELE